jgi:hypothetical protein
VTTRAEVGLWSPGKESVQGIGGALRAHWAAAKQVAGTSPFFRRSATWLEAYRRALTAGEDLAGPTDFRRTRR